MWSDLGKVFTSTSNLPDVFEVYATKRPSAENSLAFPSRSSQKFIGLLVTRDDAKQGFWAFGSARRTVDSYEAIHQIGKRQVRWLRGRDIVRHNFTSTDFSVSRADRYQPSQAMLACSPDLQKLPTQTNSFRQSV